MNISVVFDTIKNNILLGKLHAYLFPMNAANLMCSYLKKRKQKVQINNKFSAVMLSNYTDDNNQFNIGKNIDKNKGALAKKFGIVAN